MDKAQLLGYDYYIVAFSGGKDSIACYLHLIDSGVSPDRIELWHHLIDGREGSTLMDWPITEDYCQKFGDAFGSKVSFSWKKGGFEGEMNRNKSKTAPTAFQDQDDNLIECGGIRGKESTRRKFPQVSANLSVRWCSAYLKIDVCTMAINNQKRFHNSKTLVISGERAEESAARAKYKELEPDRSDNREGRSARHVDHWRPVHSWDEKRVWDIIEKHSVNPHPAYRLGWGRLSCMACIFGNKNQWRSVRAIAKAKFDKIANYEKEFETTIHRTKSVNELADDGKVYPGCKSLDLIKKSKSMVFDEPIISKNWELPSGAFGESNGPT